MQSHVFMPVETINRELDARLALAAHVVGEGRWVWTGSYRAIRRARARLPGVYLAKHGDGARSFQFEGVQPQRIVFLDEEGAFYVGDDEQFAAKVRYRTPFKSLRGGDAIAAWGEAQAQLLEERASEIGIEVRATGNPRFDLADGLLRALFEDEARAIRERWGDFILVNMNFALCNHGAGATVATGVIADRDIAREHPDHVRAAWSSNARKLARMLDVISSLAKAFPEVRIIVRPHPAENHEFYEPLFRNDANISVVHEGTALPWVLASRFMVADGCTTSVEAALAGHPAITLQPPVGEPPEFAQRIVCRFGYPAQTTGNVVELARRIMDGVLGASELPGDQEVLEKLVNLSGPSVPAFVSLIDESVARVPSTTLGEAELTLRRMRIEFRARALGRRALGDVVSRTPAARQWRAYAARKFGGLDEASMRRRLDVLGSASGVPLALDFVSEECAVIRRA